MASGFCISVALLLSLWSTGKCDQIPDGVLHMECRDRYLMIAVDLSFAWDETHFEAVDDTGVYPITEQYGAMCGYSITVLPLPGHVELRASYFSCNTDNEDDDVFTFHFNLIVTHEEEVLTYTLNKTCSPALPWSPREVTCEVNYMEVSVRSDVACPSGTEKDDWNAVVQMAYTSATSDWQVMFHRAERDLLPINITEAQSQGYSFDLTDGRLVFRTPYGQPDSFSTEVSGVPVEVVHATLFSRQSWLVLMVDLVAACSMHGGSHDGGHMIWLTPTVLHPLVSGLHKSQINIGVNGELVPQSVAEERGYTVEEHNDTVQISIPNNAEGGYRKSVASGDLYEFYTFELYLEQISVDENDVDTRLRFHRTLVTPQLPRPVFSENRTALEENAFTVYLGDVPLDVELIAAQLNGQEYTVPFTNTVSCTIVEVVHPNDTRGYTLTVPFDDPVVLRQFYKEERAMQQRLDVNYTLTVLPEKETFFHVASVMALTDVSPPVFESVCTERGIGFKLDHRPFDHLWEITIGLDVLTSELAAQYGYVMSNDGRSLQLDVPLFTHGYEYENITLNGFWGTFEILVRDPETSEVQSSTVKTCRFTMAEFIMCSSDGRMTVVVDLSLGIPSGTSPARTNLRQISCGPKEADDTRALFSFPINSCDSVVKLGKVDVVYDNEILFSRRPSALRNQPFRSDIDSVTIRCTYTLAGLHSLFSKYLFESDTVGVGQIVHSTYTTNTTEDLQVSTIEPTTVTQMPVAVTKRTRRPKNHPAAHYIRVSSYFKNLSKRRSQKIVSQVKANHAIVFKT